MKILHIQDHFYPDLGYQETHLMKAQVQDGHEVHMITANKNYYNESEFNSYSKILGTKKYGDSLELKYGFTIHRLKLRFLFLEKFHRRWLIGLKEKILDINPDLVIGHGMQSITSMRLLWMANQKGHNYKFIVDNHANNVLSNRSFKGLFYFIFSILTTKKYLTRCDGIVAINDATKNFLVRNHRIPPEKISKIGFGADPKVFYRCEIKTSTIRNKYNIKSNDLVFIYTGKIKPHKGVHLLVDSMIKLGKKYKNIFLLIVGDGDQKYVREQKMKLENQKNVKFIFLKFVKNQELYQYYSAADVSIWPDWLSIGTLEAKACSLPLIVSNVSSVMIDRVSKGNGLVFERNNIEDLIKKIEFFILNPNEIKKMGKIGLKEIIERENWNYISKQFINLCFKM